MPNRGLFDQVKDFLLGHPEGQAGSQHGPEVTQTLPTPDPDPDVAPAPPPDAPAPGGPDTSPEPLPAPVREPLPDTTTRG